VVGEELGPKVRGFTYKSKSNQSTRWGHRQRYSTIAIRSISAAG
jgi:ribosomal protein L21